MTERPRSQVSRSRNQLVLGPSAVTWEGDCLRIDIAEVGVPIPRKVVGTVRVWPEALGATRFALDPAERHIWHPIAPRARIEVEMQSPALRWQGSAYIDSNFGAEPLEDGFIDWNWSRAHLSRDVVVLYEGVRRAGDRFALALRCDRQGRWRDMDLPPAAKLPRTLFQMPRATRADAGFRPRVIRTWEDAPFYSRSAIETRLDGETVRAVHESLAMNRFRSPIVHGMLPYRMPRAIG